MDAAESAPRPGKIRSPSVSRRRRATKGNTFVATNVAARPEFRGSTQDRKFRPFSGRRGTFHGPSWWATPADASWGARPGLHLPMPGLLTEYVRGEDRKISCDRIAEHGLRYSIYRALVFCGISI